ncbi:EYxxD motif small membrane protein [Peribacillus alkalitolerans]|nr:EYxxD motif small membrane protein [Peribacillus alkalitolerans]
MFFEYVSDVSFVVIALIGSLIALGFVFVRKSRRKSIR